RLRTPASPRSRTSPRCQARPTTSSRPRRMRTRPTERGPFPLQLAPRSPLGKNALVAGEWIVTQREREFEQSAADELPTLVLADDVSQLLVHVIEQVRIDPDERDRLAEEPRRNALWFMAIITVRAMRSAMQVLATGYEEQSVGFQKLIDELHERAQQIRDDESGEF